MGQSIVVTEKPSSNRGVVRFETNRALTGMGHERYLSGTEVWGNRPPDELARRLLAKESVAGVQINGNIVTVDLARGFDSTGLLEVIENLYRFYPDADPAAAAAADPAVATEAAPESEADPASDPAAVAAEEPAAAEPEPVAAEPEPVAAEPVAAESEPVAEVQPEPDDAPEPMPAVLADPEPAADAPVEPTDT